MFRFKNFISWTRKLRGWFIKTFSNRYFYFSFNENIFSFWQSLLFYVVRISHGLCPWKTATVRIWSIIWTFKLLRKFCNSEGFWNPLGLDGVLSQSDHWSGQVNQWRNELEVSIWELVFDSMWTHSIYISLYFLA